VTDRIAITWATEDEHLAEAIRAHASYIASEVLATQLDEKRTQEGVTITVEGVTLEVTVRAAS
jgi:isoleucyl-tRNA synthetase